ncbi:hypothetical protein FKP32DRAFT_1676216 [Trametes sanguinea]|nr:hypothetical protein FKP32DRAFT_1676216 [Trametes sanguinea]
MSHVSPPFEAVSATVAIAAIDARSRGVAMLADTLDQDVQRLRETLQLPRRPERWSAVLSARLECHERVFQNCAYEEIFLHHQTLTEIHGDADETEDLLQALESDLLQARQSFEDLESNYQSFTQLRNTVSSAVDSAERDAIEGAQLSLNHAHDEVYQALSRLIQDRCVWDDCFRTVIAKTGLDSLSEQRRARHLQRAGTFRAQLEPLFDHLSHFADARQGVRVDSAKLRRDNIQEWTLEGRNEVPLSELMSELRQVDEYAYLLFTQSNLQSQAMRSIHRIVDDAAIQASTLKSASNAMLPLAQVHEAFHQYDGMRLLCGEVIYRCTDAKKIMEEHIHVLEKARDML